jgi:hypothetical protein
MADRRIEPAGCLGRALTLLGVIWLAAVVFAGVAGLRDEAGTLSALIGSTVPAFILIAVGRVLSRRAAERREQPTLPQPTTPPTEPRVTSPAAPPPQPSQVIPKPAKSTPAPAPQPDALPELAPPSAPSPPKTSQEMIEEARRRWGSRPPIP